VLDGQSRTADARQIQLRDFCHRSSRISAFCAKPSGTRDEFIELLCAKLRWTSDQVEQVIFRTAGRLASALIVWPTSTSSRRGTEPSRYPAGDQRVVGMTRESINKQLRFGYPKWFVSSMVPSSCWMPNRFRRWSKRDRERSRLEHDPEKRAPFRKKSCSIRGQATDLISRSSIRSSLRLRVGSQSPPLEWMTFLRIVIRSIFLFEHDLFGNRYPLFRIML